MFHAHNESTSIMKLRHWRDWKLVDTDVAFTAQKGSVGTYKSMSSYQV